MEGMSSSTEAPRTVSQIKRGVWCYQKRSAFAGNEKDLGKNESRYISWRKKEKC